MYTPKANGSVIALLAEYEKVIKEFQQVISNISPAALTTIADANTTNENCRSIQTILTHVVSAGYSYCIYIRDAIRLPAKKREMTERETVEQYIRDLDHVFTYTCETFENISTADLYDPKYQIRTSWDKTYDIEQLLEHAIVHIMRHRRQIEEFKLKLL
jgi:uncharacterized damage-inducible protein DinB